MRQTSPCLKNVTSHGGMRRILKKQLPALEYMEKAVKSGTYFNDNGPGGRKMTKRLKNGRRVSIDMFPTSYEVLSMHPPLPPPPKLSRKDEKRLAKEHKEKLKNKKNKQPSIDLLVKKYMKRYDDRMRAANPATDAEKEELYYKQLLGIKKVEDGVGLDSDLGASGSGYSNTPRTAGLNSAMGRKANVLNHAYEFALKQHQVLSTSMADDGTTMSEKESISIVEDLLAQEEREERMQSRKRAEKVKVWRKKRDQEMKEAKSGEPTLEPGTMDDTAAGASKNLPTTQVSQSPTSTVPSILFSKPRTIQAMHIWGKRLKAVPYDQWTLGATTSLDHWIAVDVLNMSEESWNKLLDGEMESDVVESRGTEDVVVGHASRMKDIVAVRSTLFPETLMHAAMDEDGEIEEEEKDDTERSIDELLASLGGFDDEEEVVEEEKEEQDPNEIRAMEMLDELQDWRAKNVDIPYYDWDSDTQTKFNAWLREYIGLAVAESGREVDLDATRDALLAEPPTSRDESDQFWTNIQDETSAEIFLHHLLESKESDLANMPGMTKAKQSMELFMTLPYSKQLSQLINLGKLRPIFDEYTTASDRLKFMEQNGELLLDGVEIEHLVSDPDGVITADDIGDDKLLDEYEMKDKDARFSIEMVPYGTDEFGTTRLQRARALHKAWNIQRAGRARYEEFLFNKGKLPLKEGADVEEEEQFWTPPEVSKPEPEPEK